MNKTLTIAIPAFNGDKYISIAIDSVVASHIKLTEGGIFLLRCFV